MTQEDALKIVDATEGSIKFQRIAKEAIELPRCIKLKDKTVYEYEQTNVSPKNPNSCVEVIHAHRMDDDDDQKAIAGILQQLLAQPTFYQLRTVEQLGYVVKGSVFQYKRMMHFSILVQSSAKDADYLEHRVNEFLESYTKKEVAFEEKDVEAVR